MFKRILAACILLASALAFGQGACYPAGVVLLDTGRPANGASVRVCTAGSTGSPCTPGASLFTDPTLGTPLGGSPVVTTDSHGNFGFCAAAGSNYDLQISGTGITTLNIKNLPLPPTTPIAAASLTSSSANPATVGQIKLASGDCLDWRNNANSGNIQLCKTGAAAGNVPADTFDMTAFGGARAASFISATTNPSATGAVALASADCVKFRNNANGADVNGVCKNASDQVAIGSGPFVVPSANDQAVGRATTDTIANKNLLAAASGNSVTLLNSQDTLGNVTGNGTDQTLYTFTIPANTVQAGKGIRLTAFFTNNNNSAITYKVTLGATTPLTLVSGALAANNQSFKIEIFNNAAVQNAQVWSQFCWDGSAILSNGTVTSAENFANALALKITGSQANPNTVTPKKWFIELIQ